MRRLLYPLTLAILALPAAAEPRLADLLREDLVLGLDGDGRFGFVLDVGVDSKGVIYVLDTGFDTVHRFDADGTPLPSFGRDGEAPGEFVNPTCLALDPADRLYVAGATSLITVIHPDGTPGGFVKRHHAGPAISMCFDRDGNLYVAAFDVMSQTMIHKYQAPDFRHERSFGESYAAGTDVDVRVESVYARGYLAWGSDGLLYYAQSSPQVVRTYRPDGTRVAEYAARRAHAPGLPEPEIHGAGVTFSMGPRSGRIIALPEGGFLTTFVLPGEEEDAGLRYLDLYDAKGNRIWSREYLSPFALRAMDRSRGLYVAEERGDVPVVVRYRLEHTGAR